MVCVTWPALGRMSSKSRRPETDQMKFGELRHYLAQPKDLFLTVVRDLFYLPLVLGETVAVPAATPSTNRKLACHPTCNAKLHICTPYTLLESFSPNQIRMRNCIYKQHPWRPQTVGRFVAPTASRTAPRQPPGSQCNPDCTPRNPGHWDPQRRGYSCCSGKHIYVDYEADHNPRDVQLSPWLILTCTLLWTLFLSSMCCRKCASCTRFVAGFHDVRELGSQSSAAGVENILLQVCTGEDAVVADSVESSKKSVTQ